ncbi:Modification methylase MjaII [uncultured archaeon]|nr:Modification methylase MjaII [uncultured archaeon]
MFEEKLKERFDLATSVTFQESKNISVYNWFYYKEGFSPRLVKTFVREYSLEGLGLDVFCGTGTTNLALCEMGLKNVGFDFNPLLALVAEVKTTEFDYDKTSLLIKKVINEKPKIDFNWKTQLVEETKYFTKQNYDEILELRE